LISYLAKRKIPSKATEFRKIIEAEVKRGVEILFASGAELMPHFIYCGSYIAELNLKVIILNNMKKYGIQSSVLTMLRMHRRNLITKEKSKLATEGKLKNEQFWKHCEGSINDDLESFFKNLLNQREIKEEDVDSFFLPKLTEKELKLVEEKDEEHMKTYIYKHNADVNPEEMKMSDSKDKYVHCQCSRKTFHLNLESTESSCEHEPKEKRLKT